MSDTRPLTIRVPAADLERLGALAESTKRTKSDLASEALAAYLAAQEWQLAAIRAAVEDADVGATAVSHAEVARWLRSWGTDAELSRPR